jgi:hypothetical protein
MNFLNENQAFILIEIARRITNGMNPPICDDDLVTVIAYCMNPSLIFSDTEPTDLRMVHQIADNLFDFIIIMVPLDDNIGRIFPVEETYDFSKKFLKDLRRRDEYNDQMKLEKY